MIDRSCKETLTANPFLCEALLSSEQLLDYTTAYVCQANIKATKTFGQFEVVQAEQMKQRGMEIVDVDGVHNGCPA